MADNTSTNEDQGFVPEPIPDNIADTELNGLDPADESTDSEQVETEQEETQQDQTTDDTSDEDAEEADDSGTPDEQEEAEAKDDGQEQQQPNEQQEAAQRAYQQRRQQRDYVTEQRQQIRQYEQSADMTNAEERMRVLEAKQYVDTVERNRAAIINDNLAAQASIPMFNPNDKAFNERAYQAALQSFNDNYVVTDDETGEVLGAVDRQGNNVSLRQYLQQQASLYEELVTNTQRQTQRSETKMRAKAVNPSNPGKVTSSGDELADLLDKIGDMPLN